MMSVSVIDQLIMTLLQRLLAEHRQPCVQGRRRGVGGGGPDQPGGQPALRRPQGLAQGVLLVVTLPGGRLSGVKTPLGQQRLGNLNIKCRSY